MDDPDARDDLGAECQPVVVRLSPRSTLFPPLTDAALPRRHSFASAIRFLVGIFESGYYPGLLFLIGCWYDKDELAKRSNAFQVSTSLSTAV